jgi:hypothetical protein
VDGGAMEVSEKEVLARMDGGAMEVSEEEV